MFKRKDNLMEELNRLPSVTKKRILDNVRHRREEILQEKLMQRELRESKQDKPNKFSNFRDGMRGRRAELTRQGILKPLVRVNRQVEEPLMNQMSRDSRAAEIKRLEDQRSKLKNGSNIYTSNNKINIKELKLKVPNSKLEMQSKNILHGNGKIHLKELKLKVPNSKGLLS